MSFAALSARLIAQGRTESIASRISNPAYCTGGGMPSGHPTSFSYNVVKYPDDVTPVTLTDGRSTSIAGTEVAQKKRSCFVNKAIPISVWFDKNEYDTDGNGAAVEAKIKENSMSMINRVINTDILGLIKETFTTNGLVLNPFEAVGGTPEYFKIDLETGLDADGNKYVVAADGKYGMELYEKVAEAWTIFFDRLENAGATGLKLVVNPTTFQNLIFAKIAVANPNSDLFGAATGTMSVFGIEVISSMYVANNTTQNFNMLLTQDAFAFYLYELDPITEYVQKDKASYIPGKGFAHTVKYGSNIADPTKIVVITTTHNDIISAGANKIIDVTPVEPVTP